MLDPFHNRDVRKSRVFLFTSFIDVTILACGLLFGLILLVRNSHGLSPPYSSVEAWQDGDSSP